MDCRNIMGRMMTCTDYIDLARGYARRLEDMEATRGHPIPVAREVLARKIGVSPGTLENLRNGRLKSIAAHVFAAIRDRFEMKISEEIRALEHELQIARSIGLDPRDDEMAAAEAALATARDLIGKARHER